MRTIVYIDGFNLYYGCIKGTPYKWLNLKSLCQSLLKPKNTIISIKYFTAKIKPQPSDPSAPQRQQAYLRALEHHIPEITIYYGHFLQNKIRMAKAEPPPNTVEVIKTEEKASDVNLAVQMLNDAWLDNYECAVVISNDSDMAESMRLIRQYHPNKILGLLTPGFHKTSQELKKHAHFVRTIRKNFLGKHQLPDNIPNSSIYKPIDWGRN